MSLQAASSETIYSDLIQDCKETGDCGGYTVRILNQSEIFFTSHEGNCSIKGTHAEEVNYHTKTGAISFVVPFDANVGRSYFRFNGKVLKNRIEGTLTIDYPSNPTFNKTEALRLFRTTEKTLYRCR
ncbi:MAG TPA: hypothetical protein DIC36_02455 [Gammaproteobacteria bacterium]|nr:hypothetical protein [Gammaproteobacteria bacterium]